MLQVTNNTSQVPDFQKCQILASLLPVAPSRDQPGSPPGPLEAEPGQSQPFPAPLRPPRLLWPLWVPTVHVSLWKLWFVKCPSHISSSLSDCVFSLSWMPAEGFWLQSFQDRNCSSCSSMDKAVQYPSWGERILFPTLHEMLLILVSFFNYALKPLFLLILDFWWVFFPSQKKPK